ncbi:hypothetical protein GCM10009133_16980 [Cocleimonas flava]|uniref:Secreted protein (IPTL-CTERM system target) n=1 Tax=Cocleimonas flava TaxID=634765 RepID=A0A4R1EXA4_9GAMM|nr:hypothetical protein [Cocleimonas flava]TCJ84624.1 hypothetical protein EV695_2583 [Cocleimonas flava]
MKTLKTFFAKLITLSLLLIAVPSSVFAGDASLPVINFALPAGATAVPSLSGTMLVILSLLLFVVALKISKQKNANTGKFFVTLIGVTAIVSGSGGIKMISEVNAGNDAVFINIPENITRTLDTYTPYTFKNTNAQALTITLEENDYSCISLDGGATLPLCNDGSLAPDSSCGIVCINPPD